jgi:RimJ/RimL family protein N-acetyltransferase
MLCLTPSILQAGFAVQMTENAKGCKNGYSGRAFGARSGKPRLRKRRIKKFMSREDSTAKDERSLSLEGKVVRLEPLRREHTPLLWTAAQEHLNDIFRWIPYAMRTAEEFQNGVDKILQEQAQGQSLAFATIERSSGQVIGSTRFMNMDLANRRVEIGSTWIAPAWQRTAVNTEAKYLMLCHAFELWGCFRVELKTDSLNQKSRNAILRLGAKEEGTLRQHMVTWDGRRRDSVYFSILDTEWPAVKRELETKLGA